MGSYGDEKAGFSVEYNSTLKTVHVRTWGFWDPDVASAFGETVKNACVSNPINSSLVLDMNDLKPMREEGQKSFGMLMKFISATRRVDTTLVCENQLTKLQLLRLVSEYGAKEFVKFS